MRTYTHILKTTNSNLQYPKDVGKEDGGLGLATWKLPIGDH